MRSTRGRRPSGLCHTWGTGYNTDFALDDRFVKARDNLDRKLQAVEDARWQLQHVDFRGLDDPRLIGYRAKVEQLDRDVSSTCADLLAALPQPEEAPGGLFARVRGR
jgi:hypothetical protein